MALFGPVLRNRLATKQATKLLRDELEEPHHRFLERYISSEDRGYLEL